MSSLETKDVQLLAKRILAKCKSEKSSLFYRYINNRTILFLTVSRGQKVTDHIIFGTPGTLLDWILRHKVLDPKKIKMFVLDEADVMIALKGHQDQSIRIHK